MQRTSFNYEVLVHDDASVDRTPEIIKEYEGKYLDVIKLIYQKEYQFSILQYIIHVNKRLVDGLKGSYCCFVPTVFAIL